MAISVENHNFSHPRVFNAPAEDLGISAWSQKIEWRDYPAKKEV